MTYGKNQRRTVQESYSLCNLVRSGYVSDRKDVCTYAKTFIVHLSMVTGIYHQKLTQMSYYCYNLL